MASLPRVARHKEDPTRRVRRVPRPVIARRLEARRRGIHLEAGQLHDLGRSIRCARAFGDGAGAGAGDARRTACRGDVGWEAGAGGVGGRRVGVAELRGGGDVVSEGAEAVVFAELGAGAQLGWRCRGLRSGGRGCGNLKQGEGNGEP